MRRGSGRPAHLVRRGPVYTVRFRLPKDLAIRLARPELQRSLHTKELSVARSSCLSATIWFRATMDRLRELPSPTSDDLDDAARKFFAKLRHQIDVPRQFPEGEFSRAVDWQVHTSEERMRELHRQLVTNTFDAEVERFAGELIESVSGQRSGSLGAEALAAKQLAARALKQQMAFYIHQLTDPTSAFVADDEVFRTTAADDLAPPDRGRPPTARVAELEASRPTLASAAAEYLRKKQLRGLGQSQIDETRRLLDWLEQEFGAERAVASIRQDELRRFRDDLTRVDVTLRGRAAPFCDRLTNVPQNQVKSATSTRYWSAAQAFFAWCYSEGHSDADPSASLKIDKKKGEKKRTPEVFSKEELLTLIKAPLFSGYKSPKRPKVPGPSLRREGRWWAVVLLMHTGLRAGELSQLQPSDFKFDHDVPHLKVREEDDSGQRVKSTKNEASVRDVPIHPRLLTLGLREFVSGRAKAYPKDRVFREFRLGQRGRLSDGMTQFWRAYLKDLGLWKEGRAVHVWRHTVIACLRANGAAEEDIAAFVGHSGRTVTSGYGGAQPLERKAKTMFGLEYGFDVVEALGGPYVKAKHF